MINTQYNANQNINLIAKKNPQNKSVSNEVSFSGINLKEFTNSANKAVVNVLDVIPSQLGEKCTELSLKSIAQSTKNFLKKAVNYKVADAFKAMADWKFAGGFYEAMADTTKFNLVANPIKDLVGCGLYVWASMNNKKIPEEKRPFMAALDFCNGVISVTLQIVAGFLITNPKVINGISEQLFGQIKSLDANKLQGFQETAKIAGADLITASKKLFNDKATFEAAEKSLNRFKGIKAGIVAVASLGVTTIFVKRVISYLISTPTASKLKNYMAAKEKEKKETATKIANGETAKTETKPTEKAETKPAEKAPEAVKSEMVKTDYSKISSDLVRMMKN